MSSRWPRIALSRYGVKRDKSLVIGQGHDAAKDSAAEPDRPPYWEDRGFLRWGHNDSLCCLARRRVRILGLDAFSNGMHKCVRVVSLVVPIGLGTAPNW